MTKRPNIPSPDSNDICEWVEYCGGDVAAFQATYAGSRVYIPESVSPTHPLAKAIGFEAATRLCQELGRDSFSVRMGPNSKAQHNRMLVLILSLAQFTLNQIAAASEMTGRNVARIRAKLRREGLLPPARDAGNSRENERY